MSVRDFNSILIFPGENHGVTFVDYAKPLAGFILFIFFGTGQEAIAAYKKWAHVLKLDKLFNKCFSNCCRSHKDNRNSSGTLKTFQGRSTFYSNDKRSQTLPTYGTTRGINSSNLAPPPKVMSVEKKTGFKNILFLNGHRTPSEQAAFDLTSGLRIKIDGIETKTVIEYDEDLQETPAPAYHYQKGIHETLDAIKTEGDGDDDDFGTKRYVENENDDDLVLEYSSPPQPLQPPHASMGFGDFGSVSHLNHLLSVYNEVPTINVVPSSPNPYANVRVHDVDTFVANGYDDVIEEYSPNRESYSGSGIAL
jgi:hypothetical protein